MKVWEDYEKAVHRLQKAKEWNALPDGPKYQNDTFEISAAHCTLVLVRAGQQYCSGNNYWNASPELCQVVLKIIAEDPTIINRAIQLMTDEAKSILIECEAEAKQRLLMIEEAKNA